MKKLTTCLIILFIGTCLFATVSPETIIEKIKDSDLWSFDKDCATSEEKPYIKLTYQTADDFTRLTRKSLNSELYPNKSELNFDDIKSIFKSCNNLALGPSYSTVGKYFWKESKRLSYSVQYTQTKLGRPIENAGTYIIRVFFEESVLTILLQDETNFSDQKKEYEVLNDLCFYKDGNLLDINKGLERTKGYYWKNDECIQIFYDMLKNKDSSLPSTVRKFQFAAEEIFKILDNCK